MVQRTHSIVTNISLQIGRIWCNISHTIKRIISKVGQFDLKSFTNVDINNICRSWCR